MQKLQAMIRQEIGSNKCNALRKKDLIPAALHTGNCVKYLSVSGKTINLALAAKKLLSASYLLSVEGESECLAVLKDYQIHPVTRKVLHVDFFHAEDDRLIKVKIPITYVNKSKSVAIKKGAMLNVARYYVHILCSVSNVPTEFRVDLADTDVMQRFYSHDLALPENAKLVGGNQLLANFIGKRGQTLKEEAK